MGAGKRLGFFIQPQLLFCDFLTPTQFRVWTLGQKVEGEEEMELGALG